MLHQEGQLPMQAVADAQRVLLSQAEEGDDDYPATEDEGFALDAGTDTSPEQGDGDGDEDEDEDEADSTAPEDQPSPAAVQPASSCSGESDEDISEMPPVNLLAVAGAAEGALLYTQDSLLMLQPPSVNATCLYQFEMVTKTGFLQPR
jgi:hypothetical protein